MNFWSPYLLWALTGGALVALYLAGCRWWRYRAQKQADQYPPCDAFRPWTRDCRVPGTWTGKFVAAAWLALLSGFPTLLLRYRASGGFWFLWLGAVALVGLAEHVQQAYLRAFFAAQVVDMFELDEALHGLAARRYGAAMEPTRAAYQVALEAAYRYVGLVAWGERPCDWFYVLKPELSSGKKESTSKTLLDIWIKHLGGPLLLGLSSDMVLITESIHRPIPDLFPAHPQTFAEPRCYGHYEQLLQNTPNSSAFILYNSACNSFFGFFLSFLGLCYYYKVNACLSKLTRFRYAFALQFSPQSVTLGHFMVRTRDGLPLRIPRVTVRFELYQGGQILREARNRLPSQTWRRLVNKTLLRLLRKEAAHWQLTSATDLPVRVMQVAIDGAFRKVFARYDAAQLLDRVHRQTLAELLAAQGVRSDSYLKRLLEPYLEGTHTVSVERLHEEILAELNGTAEDGYARAEERGLLVTHLHFGDWKPPKHLHEIHRQALRRLLAWQTERMPSQSATRRQRARQIFVQDVADSLYSRLPEVTLPFVSTGAHADAPARTAAWIRREWVRTLDQLVQGLRSLSPFDEVFQRVIWSAFDTADPRFIFDPALLNSIDEATRREQLAAWLYEVYWALWNLTPEGIPGAQGEPPAQMLPD